MIRDLDFPIRLAVAETVREKDGLALSSRNAYLSDSDRVKAAALSRALFSARDRAAAGQRDARALEAEARSEIESAGLSVDYVEAVDGATMERVERVTPGTALAAAVRISGTRLIDNVLLEPERSKT
jgi:pantoate--beta-alanine ligase